MVETPPVFLLEKRGGGEDRSLREKHLKKILHLEVFFFSGRLLEHFPLVATATGVVLEIQSIPTLFVTDMLTKKNPNKRSCQTPLVAMGKSKANHSERFGNHYPIEIWPFKNFMGCFRFLK